MRRAILDTTNWLIVGPGALGQLFAAHLAPTLSLTLLGRRTVARQAIRLRTPEGDHRERSVERQTLDSWRPTRSPDLVILATKAYDTLAALEDLAPRLQPTTPLLLLQNGFLVQPAITARWTGPVLCATTTEAAYRPAPNGADTDPDRVDVVHAARGETWLGDLAARHGPFAAQVAAVLADAGLTANASDDMPSRLWHKLAVNAVINPLTAQAGVLNGALAAPAWRAHIERLVREIDGLMAAEGIAPPAGGWHGRIENVIRSTASNRSSMLQDVMAGRPTEHEAILTPLLEAAARHRLPVPELEALYRSTPA